MAIFHLSKFEHELFCWYFKHLNAFLALCGYCVGKWEILGIIDEGVNRKTRILLQYWDLHEKSVEEAWCLLEWIALNSLSLRRLVVFRDILVPILVHSVLDRIMLLFGVTCVILLTIILHHVLIMHVVNFRVQDTRGGVNCVLAKFSQIRQPG